MVNLEQYTNYNVQFPVVWVIAVTRPSRELKVLPEPAFKSKEEKGRWQSVDYFNKNK
jgi:hypothetical protein